MKRTRQQRPNPRVRCVVPAPPGIDLADLAARASYTGSPYHKDVPSFAGPVPRHRPDASICPRELAGAREQIEKWLKDAIRSGHAGSWQGRFPEPVWHREGETVYEAVLTRPLAGEYHGYPLEPGERVEGLP